MRCCMKKKLELLLLQNNNYIVDGVLNKNKLIELAHNYDTGLLHLLMKDPELKEHFFSEVERGILVFKSEVFSQFINNKEFLPDSFTVYKNHIGLSTPDNKYIYANDDVVLNFPYKDCVLEGGQNKEESKREEIFFNEILAPNEINRLLDRKVLCNFKKFTHNGLEMVSDIDENDNLIIKGNNLIALHSIKNRFKNKVKLIYIDVPYYFEKNTGDAFQYNSNFKLSTWLVFLKNRLEIAKEFLCDDGSIWVHTGEDGMHYLKVLMDSIFGKEKFVGTLPRKTRDGKSDVPFNFSQDFDWILVYTKGKDSDSIVGRQIERKYIETPDFPGRPWRKADLTKQTTIQERPNSNFTMVNPRTGKTYPVNPKRSWAITQETFDEYYQNGGIGFPDDYENMSGERPFRRIFKDEDDAKQKATYVSSTELLKQFISDLLVNCKNKDGNEQITELLDRDAFSYAKPENLMKTILQITTKEKDIVLDFFLGSGTTAAVAHKMNRKYIGIEQMDYVEDVSVERLKKVINGELGGISLDVNWTGGGSFIYCELKNDAQRIVNQIKYSKTTDQLLLIFKKMKSSSFLSYRVNPKSLLEEDFVSLSFAEQKQLLLELLDNNNLYVNYSDIEDVHYNVSDEDKRLNRIFYGEEG